jgi:putative salt-induced outer membrane protein YdiY/small nuclear ribonucleoprotein (snRNP)-like protein
LLITAIPALADQVSLKNGDRLTGTIVSSDGKSLVLHSEYAGDLTLKWDAVKAIQSNDSLRVELQNGKTAVGPVTTSDDTVKIATSSGEVSAPVSDVKALTQQAAYQKLEHPGLLEGWKGGLNAGFSLTGGNSQTTNLAIGFLAARQSLKSKLAAYENSVFATSQVTVAGPPPITTTTTTANTAAGGIRYDRDFAPRVFAFGSADFYSDALQGLNLRSVFGGGLGYHAIKNDNTTLDFLGGLNYTRESYTTLHRNLVALTLGEELMHKLGKSTVLNEKLYLFPDLNSLGDYRGTFDFSSVTQINKRFGWQNSFTDVYVTNPPAGKKQNDIILTTGLNVAFGH